MSRATLDTPVTAPPVLRIGDREIDTSMTLPSLCRAFVS
jgi:hypothetical protein